MNATVESASANKLHGYGKQLLAQGKAEEAMDIF